MQYHPPEFHKTQRGSSISPVNMPAGPAYFSSFAESLANLDTINMVLNTGASAQAHRQRTIGNDHVNSTHSRGPLATTRSIISAGFGSSPIANTRQQLPMRDRAQPETGLTGGSSSSTMSSPPLSPPAKAAHSPNPAVTTKTPARGGSDLSVQETIFHVRRPYDAHWGGGEPTEEQQEQEQEQEQYCTQPAVNSRADLPSERRRLAA